MLLILFSWIKLVTIVSDYVYDRFSYQVGDQILTQIKGVGAVLIWSAVGTYIIVKICQAITGLGVSDDDIHGGLDQAEHGETSYNFQ